jgi:uncharacterized membrane protein YbhN (UPF0104 family)
VSAPNRKRLKLWIKAAVTAGLLALILRVVPWGELWSGVRSIDPWLWALVLGCFMAGHLAGALKWRLNLNICRAGLGRTDAVQIYAAGLFANLCLPSIVGGDGLKALLAGRVTGRYESVIFGGLTERLIDTLALVVLIVAASLFAPGEVPGGAGRVLFVGALVVVGAGVLFLPFALRVRLASYPRKLRRPAGRAMVGMRRLLRRPGLFLLVLAASLAIQSWFVLLNAALGRGIGIEIPLVCWFVAVPLAKAITLVPISFGGFALREVTLAAILASIAGVPEAQGVSASLLWQSVVVATGLCGGALWFLLGLREAANARLPRLGGTSLAGLARERRPARAPAVPSPETPGA